MKSKWYYRLPVKLVALLLLFVFSVAACAGLFGVALCGDAGFYGEQSPRFADSGACWQIARSRRYDMEEILLNFADDESWTLSRQEYLAQMRAQYSAENSNLRIFFESQNNGTLTLEELLGMPERGELTDQYQLIAESVISISVSGGALGSWLRVDPYQEPVRTHYGIDEGYETEEQEFPETLITTYYYLDTDLPVYDEFMIAYNEFRQLEYIAYPALWLLIASALLSLVFWIYLMCAAGHRADTDKGVITLRFLDKIPYDLFAGACFLGLLGAGGLAAETLNLHRDLPVFQLLLAGCALLAVVLLIAFTLSSAVRWKSHTLLRNTIVWRVCAAVWHSLSSTAGKVGERIQPRERTPEELAQKQEQRAQAFQKIGSGARSTAGVFGRLFGAAGAVCAGILQNAGAVIAGLWHSLGRGFDILPLVWKGVLLFAGVGLLNVIMFLLMIDNGFFAFAAMLFDTLVLWYYLDILRQMVWLNEGAKKIAAGDLNYRLPTDAMKWEFKAHGEALNTIRGGIDAAVEERVQAVEERIKSDRMRSELLTNVSHDIKTPLTSIINYVDLLKKEQVEGEKAQEYIEVLDRQAVRLKKLLEDLLEASKASTGNITVNAAPTSVGELLRQVTGEYAEKLAAARLEPIMTLPGKEAVIFADGRLLWRVFDNMMANIVKYAMPQTRVYLDLQSDASMTVVAVKNVSRERLNIAADELMERFVRGDSSRSTEGSGLGLSIAQSLTELMGGTFSLMIDGDLFKVQISFSTLNEPLQKAEAPAAEPVQTTAVVGYPVPVEEAAPDEEAAPVEEKPES